MRRSLVQYDEEMKSAVDTFSALYEYSYYSGKHFEFHINGS